jgi:succinate dehydrogenase/fumarate reductase flavoprotein subunit
VKHDKNGISRREFVAGVTGVAATLAGETVAVAQVAAPPRTWDRESDVVVVGSAGSGLAAAIEAADAGASVTIVEKGDHVGGLWIASGGHAIFGASHHLARLGIKDDLDAWYEDEMKVSEYRAVPELVRAYVSHGPDAALWMERRIGIKWADRTFAEPGHSVERGVYPGQSPDYPGGWPGAAGVSWITMLLRAVQKQNTTVLLNTSMVRVFRRLDGPVEGIEAMAGGKPIRIRARKAVVLATGGFTDNLALCMSFDPRLADTYADGAGPPGLPPYVENTGDALRVAQEIGAGLTDMSFVSFLPIKWGSKAYFVWEPRNWSVPVAGREGQGSPTGVSIGTQGVRRVVVVKNDGRRFINEAELARPHNGERPEQPFPSAYLNLPDRPRNVWALSDAEGAKTMRWDPALFQNPDPRRYPALHPDCVAVAGTLQELANKIGVPAERLGETIQQYNRYAEKGVDEEFGKPQPFSALRTPPFVAAKLCMIRHTTFGGLRVNSKAQVLDRSDLWKGQHVSIDQEKTIPRLYAAGECTAVTGRRLPHGKLGVFVTFGRIAGKNAAAEKLRT